MTLLVPMTSLYFQWRHAFFQFNVWTLFSLSWIRLICLSVHLSMQIYVCLSSVVVSLCLSMCQFESFFVCLSVCLSVNVSLFVCPSVNLSLFVCPSVNVSLFVCPSVKSEINCITLSISCPWSIPEEMTIQKRTVPFNSLLCPPRSQCKYSHCHCRPHFCQCKHTLMEQCILYTNARKQQS